MKSWSLAAAGAASLLVAGTSIADVVGYTGNVSFIDAPESVRPGALESDELVYAFNEVAGHTLESDLFADITLAGLYDNTSILTPGMIGAGSLIDSYYIHQDLEGNRRGKTAVSEFSMTFDSPIIGLILAGDGRGVHGTSLSDSDWLNPETLYPTNDLNRSRGTLDSIFDYIDRVSLSEDGMTLSMTWRSTARKMDAIRVITEGSVVPTPGAIALLGTAMFIGIGRRRRP
jgi:hypothetical protein